MQSVGSVAPNNPIHAITFHALAGIERPQADPYPYPQFSVATNQPALFFRATTR